MPNKSIESKAEMVGFIGSIPSTPFVNEAATENKENIFIPAENKESVNDNEVEFEINLSVPEVDIKIVDKTRIHLAEALEEHEAQEVQFTLFETPGNKMVDEFDNQDLERDLIKKRITLDMQKQHISLYELEKEPAYKRYGMELDNSIPSDESNFSNYMIYSNSEDPSKIEIRPNAIKDITLD